MFTLVNFCIPVQALLKKKFLLSVTAIIFSFVRFVVVCGDGEYIIYTAMALRNKSFGLAQEFVWASDSSEYVLVDC